MIFEARLMFCLGLVHAQKGRLLSLFRLFYFPWSDRWRYGGVVGGAERAGYKITKEGCYV